MFLFSPNIDWSFSHLPRLNWCCWTLPKCSYFTQMFLILSNTLLKFLVGPNLRKAAGITTWFQFTQGQCLFCHQGKTFWPLFCRWFHYYFASVWKIDTTSLTCECSCILCPNFENLMANFAALGMRPHPLNPHVARLWYSWYITFKTPFNARALHCSGQHFCGHKSPAARARELFKASTDSASLLVKIEKIFFRFGFLWGDVTSLTFFWLPSPGPAHQSNEPFFGSRFFWKLGCNPLL